LDLPLPVQSVPITTNVSDLRQLSGFFLGIPVFLLIVEDGCGVKTIWYLLQQSNN
jgi:hypothetical protein